MASPVFRINAVDGVVVGGGIADLAVAYHLSRTPGLSVRLLEREPVLASHSSGRNAAIFRPLEARHEIAALAARSVQLLDALMDSSRGGWLEQKGVLLVVSHATAVNELVALATEHALRHGMMQGRDLERLVPVLVGGDATQGLLLPDATPSARWRGTCQGGSGNRRPLTRIRSLASAPRPGQRFPRAAEPLKSGALPGMWRPSPGYCRL